MKRNVKLFAKGFCMGMADIVPGISGGTIAFILGIYEELINSLKSIDLVFLKMIVSGQWKSAWDHINAKFLVPLFCGIGVAIISMAKLISWLLDSYPIYVHSFFVGLILASVWIIHKSIDRWTLTLISTFFISATGAYVIFGVIPLNTPEEAWFLFLAGAIAISAMILPGISGSFILLILGKYQFVLNAVHERNIGIIIIFVAGIVVGILSFVRLVDWLLKHFHQITIACLLGLVLGSLRKIWPWKETLSTMIDRHGDIVPMLQKNILPNLGDMYTYWAACFIILGISIAWMVENPRSYHD